jgi:hypothetical protein
VNNNNPDSGLTRHTYDELSAHHAADVESRGTPTAMQLAIQAALAGTKRKAAELSKETARAHLREVLRCEVPVEVHTLAAQAMAVLDAL